MTAPLEDDPGAAILAAARRLADANTNGFTTQDLIKEAGVALQTFYRYFGSKDRLLLVLLADRIAEHCHRLATAARHIDDPVARLERHIRSTLAPFPTPEAARAAQFISSEHWRLHQLFPSEVWAATQSFTDLIRTELVAARAAGALTPRDPERDAWIITKVVISAYHHYAFAPDDPDAATVADDVWAFCLRAVGGQADDAAPRRRPRRRRPSPPR